MKRMRKEGTMRKGRRKNTEEEEEKKGDKGGVSLGENLRAT